MMTLMYVIICMFSFISRVLVFSRAMTDVLSVKVYIDDHYLGEANREEGPLFTLPWSPSMYGAGLHKLLVKVTVSLKERQ